MAEMKRTAPDIGPRRAPVQQRSRERFERMLEVAKALIAANGSDALKMSDIAEGAGVSIGSLYQYFPDKSAIIGVLAERYNEEGWRCVREALDGVSSVPALRKALAGVVDGYYEMFLAEPVMRDIASGLEADKTLQALYAEDCRVQGGLLEEALKRVKPDMHARRRAAHAGVMMKLIDAAVRYAITVDKREAKASLEAFKDIAVRKFLAA